MALQPVFVSGSANNAVTAAANTAPVVVTAPASIVAGNYLIAYCFDANTVVTTWTPPTGWVIVGTNQAGAANVGGGAWYFKVATGAEPASYTFTANLSSAVAGYPAVAITQWSSVAGLDAGPNWTPNATASTSAVAPSVTAVADHSVLLCAFGNYSGVASWTPPTGMTSRATTFNAGNTANAVASLDLTASGVTGTKTATWASSTGLYSSLTLAGTASAAAPIPDLTMAPIRR